MGATAPTAPSITRALGKSQETYVFGPFQPRISSPLSNSDSFDINKVINYRKIESITNWFVNDSINTCPVQDQSWSHVGKSAKEFMRRRARRNPGRI